MLLGDFGVLKAQVKIHQSHTTTQTTDQGSVRLAAPVFSDVKVLFSSDSDFEESIDNFHFKFISRLERTVRLGSTEHTTG